RTGRLRKHAQPDPRRPKRHNAKLKIQHWTVPGSDLFSMPYQPIEDYGVIGNMQTVALAGRNGSIDWFCYPNFDSPSVFAAILDDKKGGYFRIHPLEEQLTRKQVYWPGTIVLVTRFLSTHGVAEIVAYMPVKVPVDGQGYHRLIRRMKMVPGEMRF